MIILRIEHEVVNFDVWKKAFDSDPIDRKKSGVERYRILRPVDDPGYVIIDLEFVSLAEAQSTRSALQAMMQKVEGTVIVGPQIKLLDMVESKEY